MNRLNLYLFHQLIIAFIFACTAVTFVILFAQSFRMLSMVIENSATMWIFFRLMATSVPTFLPLVMPLGLGVAVLFVYHKLAVDSEIVVMRAVGVSPLHQAKPALILAALAVLFCYILTIWLAPAANRSLVSLQYHMRDSYAVLLSRPGNFNDITEGLTFYARERGSGGSLEGILMHDVRKPATPVTLMAARGQVLNNADGQPQLVVYDGRRQEMNMATGQLSQLAFDQYVLDINAMRGSPDTRLPDPREQTVTELLFPTTEMLQKRATQVRLLAEMHQRLTSPLLALSYAMIALAAILAGEFNRRGMSRRILLAAFAIVATQASVMSLGSLIAREAWLAPALYIAVIAPTLVSFALINMERLRRIMARILPQLVTS